MTLTLQRRSSIEARATSRVAVIDIGSNSIRLVVYDELNRSPVPLFNEKIMCGLGRTVEKTGRLNPEGVTLALDNIDRFARLIDGMDVGQVEVLATAAVRDASDGAAFVSAIEQRTGLTVRTIAGEEEARLSALGVLSGTPGADGLMGDLGGGSLELVGLDRGVIGPQVTMPLGPLRLLESCGGKVSNANRIIDQHLEALPWLSGHRDRPFYPVGGSWRALAKLHMEQVGHPLHIIHHYCVPGAQMRDFAGVIARQSRSSLDKMSSVSRRRSDTLPFAALAMERLLRHVQPSMVVFSAHGLREGLLFDMLSPEIQRQDPLVSSCASLAKRIGRFAQGEIMAGWTTSLFAGEDESAGRLRRAACLLSDLGWSEHPDYRAEHAYLRVLRMPFAGIDHDERAFLALTLYIRYGGRMEDPHVAMARSLLDSANAAKANILGLTLRLGQTLTGGVVTMLQRTALSLDEETLYLILPEDVRALIGDTVQRRLDSVAKSLNRRGAIVSRS
ncbi:exopolyphosphatase [Skermanella aerolata]|uniref:Exopolyphosphatase n=1 Tax=Skermanella aerolata TaxID=393310 RepID=A0A512DHW0_9PROT|nr:Ppx/GppA family phosphatase [Skermanella aerolata]KJB97694.1 exopolyphosphatase [Skermanella aerolata KACC 11604]GEO36036.1 exopolyphosphatase [Skermanella aerolata]